MYYHYDHTAIGTYPNPVSFAKELGNALRAKGWTVIERYMGHAPGHGDKYEFMDKLLGGSDNRLPSLLINRENCEYLITSMENAPMRLGTRGFEKDKSSERDKKTPQEEATHFSDAFDMLAWGELNSNIANEPAFMDNFIG